MEAIRNVFAKLNLKADYKIGLIDSNHILIHLNDEDDYHRIWLRTQWNIYQYAMIVSKWHVNFTPENESPILPVWISMPYLPPHMFDKDAIEIIAMIVGTPMRVDLATATLSRPSKARVCVEVDVSKDLPKRGWVGQGKTGFWQTFEYEEIPHYCIKCMKIGHQNTNCIVYNQETSKEKAAKTITDNSSAQNKAGNKAHINNRTGKEKQIYILKHGETLEGTSKEPASKASNEGKENETEKAINEPRGMEDKEANHDQSEEEKHADENLNSIQQELHKETRVSTAKTTDDIEEEATQIEKNIAAPIYATDIDQESNMNINDQNLREGEIDEGYQSNNSEHSEESNEEGSQVQETPFQLVTKRKKQKHVSNQEHQRITRSTARGTQTSNSNQSQ